MDDAVASPGTRRIGKDNIHKFFQGMLAAPTMQFSFYFAVDVARSGDLAEDRGAVVTTYRQERQTDD